jgi:hypothetical protein
VLIFSFRCDAPCSTAALKHCSGNGTRDFDLRQPPSDYPLCDKTPPILNQSPSPALASRSNNLPKCSAFQRERCKSGSKAGANLRAQRAHYSRLQRVGLKCCVKLLPLNTRAAVSKYEISFCVFSSRGAISVMGLVLVSLTGMSFSRTVPTSI